MCVCVKPLFLFLLFFFQSTRGSPKPGRWYYLAPGVCGCVCVSSVFDRAFQRFKKKRKKDDFLRSIANSISLCVYVDGQLFISLDMEDIVWFTTPIRLSSSFSAANPFICFRYMCVCVCMYGIPGALRCNRRCPLLLDNFFLVFSIPFDCLE